MVQGDYGSLVMTWDRFLAIHYKRHRKIAGMMKNVEACIQTVVLRKALGNVIVG